MHITIWALLFGCKLSASIDLYAMLVGWKFRKRWSMACLNCCDKQCFRASWIYSKSFIQDISNVSWTGALFCFTKSILSVWISLAAINVIILMNFFHQETLVRVALWCIGEYGDLLINNVGMLDVEDPITVSEWFLDSLYIILYGC